MLNGCYKNHTIQTLDVSEHFCLTPNRLWSWRCPFRPSLFSNTIMLHIQHNKNKKKLFAHNWKWKCHQQKAYEPFLQSNVQLTSMCQLSPVSSFTSSDTSDILRLTLWLTTKSYSPCVTRFQPWPRVLVTAINKSMLQNLVEKSSRRDVCDECISPSKNFVIFSDSWRTALIRLWSRLWTDSTASKKSLLMTLV